MQTLFSIFFLLIGLLFGVWNRWKEFYPTLLFWIIANLLYNTLLHNYRVWEYHPVGIDHIIFPTHTIIGLKIPFFNLPIRYCRLFRKAS